MVAVVGAFDADGGIGDVMTIVMVLLANVHWIVSMGLADTLTTATSLFRKAAAVVPVTCAHANHQASFYVTLEGGVARHGHTGHTHSTSLDHNLLWLLLVYHLRLRRWHHVAWAWSHLLT